MRFILIALVIGFASPAAAQRETSGYLLEFDGAQTGAARDFASRFRVSQQIDPNVIYVQPSLEQNKQIYQIYVEQTRNRRIPATEPDPRFDLDGVRIRRYNADPNTSLFAPDLRSELTAEELGRLTPLEGRFGGGANVVLRPNAQSEFNEAFEDQNAFSLPMPDGVQRPFRPVEVRSGRRLNAWSGETTLPGDVIANFDMSRRNGVVSGRLRAEGVLYDLYEIGPSTFAWVRLNSELQSDGFTPDHPGESADGLTRDSASAPAPGPSPRQCPVTPVPGATLNILFYYTPAALGVAMDKSFVGELDRPLMEFVRALELSEISGTTVETNEIVALPFAYTDDQGRSDCADPGACAAPWSRHLFTFMRNADVIAERRRRRADVVVLVVRDAGACGYTHPNVIPGGATSDLAFAAVAISCLGGRATLAHELGHLLGTRHERPANRTDIAFAFQNRRPQRGWASVGANSCYTEIGGRPGLRDLCSRNLYEGPRYSNTTMAPAGDEFRENRNETEVIRRHLPCVASFGDRL